MKRTITILSIILLTGCAIDMSRDSALNVINGISYKQKGNNEYLKEYKKTILISNTNMDKVKLCTLRNVTNRDVGIGDSSKSFVGSYTGNYYNINSYSKINGGDVVSLASDHTLVANGSTDYVFDAGIVSVKRVVKFTIDILKTDKRLEYTFSNIQQAQTDTGSIQNSGFSDIGTWKPAAPAQAIRSLDDIVYNINNCINQS